MEHGDKRGADMEMSIVGAIAGNEVMKVAIERGRESRVGSGPKKTSAVAGVGGPRLTKADGRLAMAGDPKA
jgi:hypothetical protein